MSEGSASLLELEVLHGWPVKKAGKLSPALHKATDLFTTVTRLEAWRPCTLQCGRLATCISVRHMDLTCPGNCGRYIDAGDIFDQCSNAREDFFFFFFLSGCSLDFPFFFNPHSFIIICIKCVFWRVVSSVLHQAAVWRQRQWPVQCYALQEGYRRLQAPGQRKQVKGH